jgi:hypothetical protein
MNRQLINVNSNIIDKNIFESTSQLYQFINSEMSLKLCNGGYDYGEGYDDISDLYDDCF